MGFQPVHAFHCHNAPSGPLLPVHLKALEAHATTARAAYPRARAGSPCHFSRFMHVQLVTEYRQIEIIPCQSLDFTTQIDYNYM